MKIIYIGHSGFLIEFDECTFLFDYFKTESNNGIFPDFNKSNPLMVFASHFHSDHYNTEIFHMFRDVHCVRFILSKEIQPKLDTDTIARNSITAAAPNCEYKFNDKSGNEIKINTLKSTDEGVAFVVEYCGKTIYHAGDLNWWAWEDDTEYEAGDMKSRFTAEIDRLTKLTPKIDIAFLPLDPRQGQLFHIGFDYVMKTANIERAVPMHLWNDFSVIEKLEQMETSASYRAKIIKNLY